MESLSAARLLDVWERGQALSPDRRALLLLEAATPRESAAALARLPVGRRDARLLTLRSRLFGDTLHSVVACPECAESLEWSVPTDGLRAELPAPDPPAPATVSGGGEGAVGDATPSSTDLELEESGYTVRFRLPTTEDVMAVGARGGGATLLLDRCVTEARRADQAVAAAELPDAVVGAVARTMEAADPQARVALALTCPACGHRWESVFDIVGYLWAEIEVWARRTLRDVHTLASRYGWTESEILAMSAWRRQAYLNLIHG